MFKGNHWEKVMINTKNDRLMVGFRAPVEEAFQVKGAARGAPSVFHAEW